MIAHFQTQDNLRVDFTIPQRYAYSVKIGDKVFINNKNKDKSATGTVYAIDANVSDKTHTLAIRASVDDKAFMPGSYVDVILNVGDAKETLVIPQTAVSKSLHGDMVYKVVDGKAVASFVKIGARRDNLIVVKQGLKFNDPIVTAGLIKIKNGNRVSDKNAINSTSK